MEKKWVVHDLRALWGMRNDRRVVKRQSVGVQEIEKFDVIKGSFTLSGGNLMVQLKGRKGHISIHYIRIELSFPAGKKSERTACLAGCLFGCPPFACAVQDLQDLALFEGYFVGII